MTSETTKILDMVSNHLVDLNIYDQSEFMRAIVKNFTTIRTQRLKELELTIDNAQCTIKEIGAVHENLKKEIEETLKLI